MNGSSRAYYLDKSASTSLCLMKWWRSDPAMWKDARAVILLVKPKVTEPELGAPVGQAAHLSQSELLCSARQVDLVVESSGGC
jgi:hypothetical protein